MKTGYERTTGIGVKMDCPKCSGKDTWRIKSLYSPGIDGRVDSTEELWECKECGVRWNYEQKIIMVVGK